MRARVPPILAQEVATGAVTGAPARLPEDAWERVERSPSPWPAGRRVGARLPS